MKRRRRQFYMLIAITTVVTTVAGTALGFMAKHEPAFYKRAEIADDTQRQHLAQEFLNRSSEFFNLMTNGQAWAAIFTQEQLNGYLQDEQSRTAGLFTFPDSVTEPRVEFDADRLRIGFRYGEGWSAVVVSVDLRTWLVAKEPNVIALELCGMSVGGLPLGTHALMDYVTEAAREWNADVTWYRNAGHPVALVRLQANQSRPTLQLRRFEIQPGKLLLNGKPMNEVAPPPVAAVSEPK